MSLPLKAQHLSLKPSKTDVIHPQTVLIIRLAIKAVLQCSIGLRMRIGLFMLFF